MSVVVFKSLASSWSASLWKKTNRPLPLSWAV
jgi:hypothetical protein